MRINDKLTTTTVNFEPGTYVMYPLLHTIVYLSLGTKPNNDGILAH